VLAVISIIKANRARERVRKPDLRTRSDSSYSGPRITHGTAQQWSHGLFGGFSNEDAMGRDGTGWDEM